MPEKNTPQQKEHPTLEALLWLIPILGEIKDIREIQKYGRKGLYYGPSTPNISPGEFACNDFLIRELIRYGILGYVTMTGFAIYGFVQESMKHGVMDTLYSVMRMGL